MKFSRPWKLERFEDGAYRFLASRCPSAIQTVSPVEINRRDAAPTPTGFAKSVGDDFPVFHVQRLLVRR